MTAVSYINHIGGCRSSACDTAVERFGRGAFPTIYGSLLIIFQDPAM
jgi:hypothetical protein